MDREWMRLLQVLQEVAYDAGYLLIAEAPPDAAGFCLGQYNQVRARIVRLEPAVAAVFLPLPADASAVSVRIAARALAAHVQQRLRDARRAQVRTSLSNGLTWLNEQIGSLFNPNPMEMRRPHNDGYPQ